MADEFFASTEVRALLQQTRAKLATVPESEAGKEKTARLRVLVDIIDAHPDEFDARCQINIGWMGSAIRSALNRYVLPETQPADCDDLIGISYRLLVEFDLSMRNDLSFELRKVQEFIEENADELKPSARRDIQWARQQMPIAVLKKLLGSEVLQNVQSAEKYKAEIDARFQSWGTELDDREKRADLLKQSLEKYRQGFNFVGLFEGFDDLSKRKQGELAKTHRWLVVFGALAVTPLFGELVYVLLHLDTLGQIQLGVLLSAVPVISLTILFLYFFRISLRNSESVRSQLLQLELRKTLCRFIQSYADYAKSLKERNEQSLSKFENVIFSGLVSTDEKLPATFDGLEQLTNLIKTVRA